MTDDLQPLLNDLYAWAVNKIDGRTSDGIETAPGRCSVYSAADLASVLYTINRLHTLDDGRRAALAHEILRYQDPATGAFATDGRHGLPHANAYAVAGLELLDVRPPRRIKFVDDLIADWPTFERWLDGRNWADPWGGAGHDVPAILSLVANLDLAPRQWFDRVFDWLDREQDPASGYWRRGAIDPADVRATHLGAAFHFYFVYEHLRRPIRHCDAIVTSTLNLIKDPGSVFAGKWPSGYIDLDAAYALARATRVVQHRRGEAEAALRRMAAWTLSKLTEPDARAALLVDLHEAFGTIGNLAVMQEVVPDAVPTKATLKNVLDRRPFL